MTHAKFNKLISNLWRNDITLTEAKTCAKIIDDFVTLCDDTQSQEGFGDIFGTEGWQHWIGIDD